MQYYFLEMSDKMHVEFVFYYFYPTGVLLKLTVNEALSQKVWVFCK